MPLEYLDPEIAGEGVSAESAWMPEVEKPRIPTYEGIKSIKKYFPQFTGRPYQHQAFPCWLYHPVHGARKIEDILTGEDPPRIIKRASEIAKELGCEFRKSTQEEIAQGWPLHRWVYSGEWRATPFHTEFDPKKPDTGKHVVYPEDRSSKIDPNMISGIVAAVMARTGGENSRGKENDPAWLEFQAFKAWKESLKGAEAKSVEIEEVEVKNGMNALQSADERANWEAEAISKGIRIDGRWSLARLKAEVEKAA